MLAYASESFHKLLGYNSAAQLSIFHVNAEMSYIKWQEILSSASSDILIEDSILLSAKKKPIKVKIASCLLEVQGVSYLYYAPLHQEGNIGLEKKELVRETSSFSYDYAAPNAVYYFSSSGDISYKNERASQLSKEIQDIQSLFLEPEIGALPDALKGFSAGKEHIIRMIMKSSGGMKEGYSRVSIHPSNEDVQHYRLEFLESDGMSLMDRPLEDAMVEINRLTQAISEKKEILIDDSLQDFSFNSIVTKSPRYKKVLSQVAQVADTDSTVLITGETGTGKEMLCNLLYKLSDRSDELIIKVNCATIPGSLIESVLFGHEKGAFTDAKEQRKGKFELAHKGTIFLDEIGEMPYEMQAKLLRVLQEGEIERVGNPVPITVDVRVIAATNRNLEVLVKEKKFRADLYYRLNVFPIYNIPLRERRDDIQALTEHFIAKANLKTGRSVSKVMSSDIKLLEAYDFPGNVRELENLVERAVISSNDEMLQLNFLLQKSEGRHKEGTAFLTLEEAQRKHIIKAMEMRGGKVTGRNSAAELLGIHGKTLVSRIKKLGINPKEHTH